MRQQALRSHVARQEIIKAAPKRQIEIEKLSTAD